MAKVKLEVFFDMDIHVPSYPVELTTDAERLAYDANNVNEGLITIDELLNYSYENVTLSLVEE